MWWALCPRTHINQSPLFSPPSLFLLNWIAQLWALIAPCSACATVPRPNLAVCSYVNDDLYVSINIVSVPPGPPSLSPHSSWTYIEKKFNNSKVVSLIVLLPIGCVEFINDEILFRGHDSRHPQASALLCVIYVFYSNGHTSRPHCSYFITFICPLSLFDYRPN